MGKRINNWKASFKGVKTASCTWQFWVITIVAALIFIFIFNLLSAGNNFLQLLIALPFLDKFSIIGQVYQEFFINLLSLEKILMLLASFGQGVIIALIVYVWKSRRKFDEKVLLKGAGASLLALIGAGCPMCGGTIILPILLGIFGAGAFAFLQSVSIVLMIVAIIVIVFAIKQLGFLCYMQPKSKEKKEEENEES